PGLRLETGVGPRLLRRDQRELRRAVQAAGLRPGDDLGGLHGHGGRDTDRLLGGPLLRQGLDTGTSGDQALPGRGCVATQRCGCADTGDDHGAIGRAHGNSFSNGYEDSYGATAGWRGRGSRPPRAVPRGSARTRADGRPGRAQAWCLRMYSVASPTVLRFLTSSSGILTSKRSSAATTTSTMDSESTSRSSVKDLSSWTSSTGMPAISFTISARPATISS